MEITTKFGYWIGVAVHTTYQLQEYHRPEFVGKHEVPATLNELTIGQIISLSTINDSQEPFYSICDIILGMSKDEVDDARAVDVVRFVGWVFSQVKKINKLFESANLTPTQSEVQAGIKKLNFGLFGMLDWYAKRMGYTNHDDVLNVGSMRIYKCLDMDAKTTMFQRKLQENIENDYRRKNRANSH